MPSLAEAASYACFKLHLLSGMCRLGKWRATLVGSRRFL